ncbi:MAG: hypothetical protein R3212_14145 [Xanthomonadales bacterium]|nr:hypothetical protein [Xanthomonadales bacterium]
MINTLPIEVQRCIEQGAHRLGRALERLEWPNSGKDGPVAEINGLISLMYYLQAEPEAFHIYAEGTCAGGRIDMMACNGPIALAVEAKAFGKIADRSESCLKDLQRMKTFKPELTTKLASGNSLNEWWEAASQRWGIILIQAFRGREISDAWVAPDTAGFLKAMSTYSGSAENYVGADPDNPTGFLKLWQQFEPQNRGRAQITDATRWPDTVASEGWFLWGAIPL